MTPQEAEALAARVLAAIDHSEMYNGDPAEAHHLRADRERVASDLAVFLAVRAVSAVEGLNGEDVALDVAERESTAGLRRTADLYGVDVAEGWANVVNEMGREQVCADCDRLLPDERERVVIDADLGWVACADEARCRQEQAHEKGS